jgi:ABC-type transport system involved in cytochrome c biogenesis permease subunit
MNAAIPIIGGLVILLWVIIAPIYCVVKLAEFKKRSKLGWGVFAVAAMPPSFIAVSLLPSLASADERRSYEAKFTRDSNRAGYILTVIISLALIAIYFLSYASKPTPAALRGVWLHIHFTLLSVACSAILVASIFSFVTLTKNSNFPTVSLVLLNATAVLLFASIISGAVWAHSTFGSFWSWDPKETWSLILMSTSIVVYTYAAIRVPGAVSQAVVSAVYLALFVFGVFGVSYFMGGLWPAFLVGR